MSFLFERDFDQEIEAEREAGISPVSGHDKAERAAELAASFAKGEEAGFAKGMEAGRREAEAQMRDSLAADQLAVLQALLPQIETLRATEKSHRLQRELDLARMSLALAERVLPEVLDRFGIRRIEAFCHRALTMAEGAGGVEIRLSPPAHAALAPLFAQSTTLQGTPLHLLADDSLGPHEARAAWAGGGADYAADRLGQEILATLRRLSGTEAASPSTSLAAAAVPGQTGAEK